MLPAQVSYLPSHFQHCSKNKAKWSKVFKESVTTDRYGRTVALVRVGDTIVNEELIRQRACLGVHPVL
jgi:endonuclease YncB( thermonuclease family)